MNAGTFQVEVPAEPIRLNTRVCGGGYHLGGMIWVFSSHHYVVFRGE